MSVYGTSAEFVDRMVGTPSKKRVELAVFNAWLEGVCACKTNRKFPVETPYVRGSVKARAWIRGFRAWERDAKHRK